MRARDIVGVQQILTSLETKCLEWLKTEFKCWTRPTSLKNSISSSALLPCLLGVQWGSASLPDSEAADAEQAIFCWLLSHCKSCPSESGSPSSSFPLLFNPPLPILLPGLTWHLPTSFRATGSHRFSELLLTFLSECGRTQQNGSHPAW